MEHVHKIHTQQFPWLGTECTEIISPSSFCLIQELKFSRKKAGLFKNKCVPSPGAIQEWLSWKKIPQEPICFRSV